MAKQIHACAILLLASACAPNVPSPEQSLAPLSENLAQARQMAAGDPYLGVTQRLQCGEIGPDGKATDAAPNAPNLTVPPAQIFDNLYYIGGSRTGSWLITTSDGYIMIDAMYGDSPETVTVPGMRALGLDPTKLKYIIITHAGPDHAGGAKYFQERYGTRIIMSAPDWEGILNPRPGSWVLNDKPLAERPPQERNWMGPPAMDLVGRDGETVTLGDTSVRLFFTPRTANGGGLSMMVPVFDKGRLHMWATYGNVGMPRSASDRALHRQSIQRFSAEMTASGVDSITSSHPFVDGSDVRARELQNRAPDGPNPFVIGADAAQRYVGILDQCTAYAIARDAHASESMPH